VLGTVPCRQGSNFLKLCVLRVCQESERHLDKVQFPEEEGRGGVVTFNVEPS
jgi:hypothetical protein